VGEFGRRLFGLVLFCAGATSIVGAAFTSVSFLKTLFKPVAKYDKWFIIGFIAFSTFIMAVLGGAAKLVIFAGALNGLILPFSLGLILIGGMQTKVVGDYKHPKWLLVIGFIVVAVMAYMGIRGFGTSITRLFA
jgi:Mn2+/Fe2+ NRAMP family transporter